VTYNPHMRGLDLHRQLMERLDRLEDVEFTRFEVDRLIEHILGIPIGEFWPLNNVEINPNQNSEIERVIGDRDKGIPLAYSLGYAYFNGIRIEVNSGVLIPRQETEGLAIIGRELVKNLVDKDELRILDFGTGSGCIAVWLALELPFSIVWATDISRRAIETARCNVKRYGLTMRVVTLKYDGLEGIVGPCKLDMIISNPPYIAEDDSRLDESVRLYEPGEALIAPSGGLHYFRHIARWAPELLAPKGYIALEVGEGQAAIVARIFAANGAADVEIRKDMANVDRYVIAVYDR
jgi:release factor glutamine methyltransferase